MGIDTNEQDQEIKEIDDLPTLRDIYKLLVKEVQVNTLQPIPIVTYQKIAAKIGRLKRYQLEGIERNIKDRLVELISSSAKMLVEIRYLKIVQQQQNQGTQSVSSAKNTQPFDYSKLTEEEKYILDGQREFQKRKENVVSAMLKGRTKVLQVTAARIRSKKVIIRFIRPIGQFMGVDMRRYGPYKEEDVAILPFENARSLMANGIALEIDAAIK